MAVIRENIRKNLGYYLSLKKMSQKEFAEKIGVSQSSVTCWLKGKNSPDIEVVARICDVLEISVLDLFGSNEKRKMLDNISNAKSKQALEEFKKLKPEFQDYVLQQMQKLKELQDETDK